ncbi:MAG: hypothetical protein CL681_12960 [Blastopirellula sp.]|nr:hypothetical protein [Blastopirellula sp.]
MFIATSTDTKHMRRGARADTIKVATAVSNQSMVARFVRFRGTTPNAQQMIQITKYQVPP